MKRAGSAASLPVAARLAAGPPRGLGAADTIAQEAARSSDALEGLVDALSDTRPHVQARAANAVKKLQQQRPDLLHPYAKRLLRAANRCQVLEARWNLTIIVGALPLRGRDKALAIDLLFEALRGTSALLRTFALQGLCDLAADDAHLQARVRPIVEEFAATGTAAMRARARKLLVRFE